MSHDWLHLFDHQVQLYWRRGGGGGGGDVLRLVAAVCPTAGCSDTGGVFQGD